MLDVADAVEAAVATVVTPELDVGVVVQLGELDEAARQVERRVIAQTHDLAEEQRAVPDQLALEAGLVGVDVEVAAEGVRIGRVIAHAVAVQIALGVRLATIEDVRDQVAVGDLVERRAARVVDVTRSSRLPARNGRLLVGPLHLVDRRVPVHPALDREHLVGVRIAGARDVRRRYDEVGLPLDR